MHADMLLHLYRQGDGRDKLGRHEVASHRRYASSLEGVCVCLLCSVPLSFLPDPKCFTVLALDKQ